MNLGVATATREMETRTRFRVRNILQNIAPSHEYDSSAESVDDLFIRKLFVKKSDAERDANDLLVWDAPVDLRSGTSTVVPDAFTVGYENVDTSLPRFDIWGMIDSKIVKTIEALLLVAQDEHFQDGMESNLSLGIGALVRLHPAQTMLRLTEILARQTVSHFILSEILQFLGRVDSNVTRESRLGILTTYLCHQSALVRDSAALALADMKDPRVIDDLRKAIEAERVRDLRDDMISILRQLGG